MRAICAILLVGIVGAFAASINPSLEASDSVLKGTVISNVMVRVMEHGRLKAQLWRAEIEVSEVIKQDQPIGKRVFLYYEQGHSEEWGTNGTGGLRVWSRVCPEFPKVVVGMTKKFYCIRCVSTKPEGDILMIPEHRWMEDPPVGQSSGNSDNR